LTSPSDEAVVPSTTPLLSAVALFQPSGSSTYDNGCYPLAYDFKVMTAAGGGETVADSGWLYDPNTPSNINNWTVPQGALRDGETYYVSVQTDDSELMLTPLPATTITHFTVKLRQGAGGPSPTDTVGSTPSGTTTPAQGAPSPGLAPASETVNLLTGDLALTAGTHSLKTLGGSPAPSLSYNSLDADVYGLDAHYFVDTGDHSFSTADTLIGQKIDPMVDFNWGLPPIGALPLSGATGFLVRWTGTIYIPDGSTSTPDGNWQFGVQAGGGMRVCFDQTGTCSAANAAVDSWTAGASESTPVYGATLSNVTPGPHAITVEAWVPTGPNVPTELWLQNLTSGASNPNPFIVPSSWLSSTPASLPAGWSLSGNSYNAAWTGLVDEGSQVVLIASDGSTADFLGSGTGQAETFQPPAGDTDLLTRNSDGTLKLTTRAGDVYTFTTNGLVSSITTAEDATATSGTNPAALQYTYSNDPTDNGPLQLTAITDPVSGRSVTLNYNGNGTCPVDTSTGVPLDAPVDMLCAINYWDNAQTTLAYNTLGELAEVDNPGGVSGFAYDSAGRLDDLEDPLAYAAIQAGQRSDCPANSSNTPTCDTTIGYMVSAATCAASFTPSCAQVATVTQPAPTVGAAQPQRSYCYANSPASSTCTPTASTTTMSIAGFSPASGYDTRVIYNANGEIVSHAGPTGAAATTGWDTAERPVTSVNPAGLQTTTVYDNNSNVTDSYGPAPTACFSTTAPYLPLSNPSGCGVDVVPHTHHGYDEAITGPDTGLWSNLTVSGPPCQETTGLTGDTSLSHVWGSSVPVCANTSGAWSLQMTGLIDLPTAGSWTFQLASQSNLTVSMDGAPLGQATGNGSWGTNVNATLNVTSPGWHQIQLSYVPIQNPTGGQSNGFSVSYQPPGGTMTVVPYSAIDPNYGLTTSTIDPDGKVTIITYSNPAGGIDAIDGLATHTIQDPSTATVSADGFPASLGDPNGLSLDTQTTYEPPGAGAYFRKLSSTLPAGNATTYSYYSGTAGPQAEVCGVIATTPQGGQLEQQTDPAVSGVSRVQQFVYDAVGRQVGVRVGSTTTISSAGWQCTTYDSSTGRMTSQTWPTNGSASARTATYCYGVGDPNCQDGAGGNPLVTAVTDQPGVTCTTPTSVGCVTSTVDLLGRVVSYTDAHDKTTTTSYAQDGQIQSTSGVQGSITSGYDPNSGQPTSTTLNGTTLATASYDTAGRMSNVVYANGTSASLGYDSYGNQTKLDYTNTATNALIDGQQTVASPAGRITSATTDGGSNYIPITATRVADTRTGSGQPYAGQHLTAGGVLTVQVSGANNDGVPADASAVVLDVIAMNATAPTYETVYPAGTTRPNASDITLSPNQMQDNQITTSLSSTGQLTIYNYNGTTDVAVSVEGYFTPVPAGGAGYNPVTPTRLADTRAGSGHQDQGQTLNVTTQTTDVVQVTGNAGIPTTGVTAAVVEMTINGPTYSGYLVAYPDGTTPPTPSSLNYAANVGSTREVTVALSSAGKFDVTNHDGITDLIVDVVGYYTTGSGARYVPVTPTRIADSRANSGLQLAGHTLSSGATANVTVPSEYGDGVPANATAVVLNVTELNATAPAYFTVWPTGTTRPATTNLTFPVGVTNNNEATVALGTSGQISIYNFNGNTDVLVDVEGYYTPATTTDATSYSYDGAGRLTQAALPSTTYTYGYGTTSGCPDNNAGANTNRTSVTVTGGGAGTTSYCYNTADQLTSTTVNGGTANTNYTYDPDGNQTNDGGTTLTWDSANRLATTTNASGAVTTYTYDPLDRVIQQQDGTTTVQYSYASMTTAAAAILDTNSNLIDGLVSLPAGVTVTVPTGGLGASIWSHTNLQGDTTLTATDTGTPQGNPIVYDPWGVPPPGSSPVGNAPAGSPALAAYGAQGKLTDPNNDLITMGARPYNPGEAHFLTVDPVDGGCANAYTYSFGDPLNNPDLTGRDYCPTISASIALEVGEALSSGANAAEIASLLPFGGFIGNIVAKALSLTAGVYGAALVAAAQISIASARRSGIPGAAAKVVLIIPTIKIFGFDTGVPTLTLVPVPVVYGYGGGKRLC
jgi:RHS repeat-associated protein